MHRYTKMNAYPAKLYLHFAPGCSSLSLSLVHRKVKVCLYSGRLASNTHTSFIFYSCTHASESSVFVCVWAADAMRILAAKIYPPQTHKHTQSNSTLRLRKPLNASSRCWLYYMRRRFCRKMRYAHQTPYTHHTYYMYVCTFM